MLVRFYAVGREISGRTEYRSEAGDPATLRTELEGQFGTRMGQLFDASSLMFAGKRIKPTDAVIFGTDDVIDLLPPFAGG